VDFRFVYHGFYVDSVSKKKLSSRDGASNVKKLITEAIAYFEKKYEDSQFSPDEIKSIARKLAIGSIILNDIKQDKKNPVAISSDIEEACRTFEESGGAYILYSIARAKSILAKVPD
jgi:arginine--tRNA ligase